jgi:hypothetical protein
VAQQAVRLMDEAAEAENYGQAINLAKLAISESTSGHDKDLVSQTKSGLQEIQKAAKLFEDFQAAQATLAKTPDDPAANFSAGLYYCSNKDDWKNGLSHLARGNDPEFKALAQRELKSPPTTADARLALADAWWDAGQAAEGTKKIESLRRAGFWYEKVRNMPLNELNKVKIDKRLEELTSSERKNGGSLSASRQTVLFGKAFPLINSSSELAGWQTNHCRFSYSKGMIDLRSGDIDCPIIVKNVILSATVKCHPDDVVRLLLRNCDQGRYFAEVHNGTISIVKQNRKNAAAYQSPDGPEEVLGKASLPKTKYRSDLLFDFKFSAKNNELAAYVGNVLYVQAKDKNAPFTEGSVGIGTTNSNTLYFSDIKLLIQNKASFSADHRNLSQKNKKDEKP